MTNISNPQQYIISNPQQYIISNPQQYIIDNGYRMEQSFSDYWRLMKGEDVIFDDSANEDVYDEDSAAYFFAYAIANDSL